VRTCFQSSSLVEMESQFLWDEAMTSVAAILAVSAMEDFKSSSAGQKA
jgi:hypothetical protein